MSMSISATDFGTLDQIVASTAQVQQNITQLANETSSGFLSSDYAGLGQAAAPSLDLSAQISQTAALQTNTQSAGTVQAAAQTALGQIESIASNFATQAIDLTNLTGTVGNISSDAQAAMQQVAVLLNTKVGDVYVFAGQDSANPPIPNPTTMTQSAFYTAIQTAVSALGTNGAAATQATGLAAAGSAANSPFSASLTAGGSQSEVDIGGNERITLAPLASANSDAISTGTGTTSTGSYTHDILYSLASLGSLTQVQAASPNFLPFVQGIAATLNGAVTAINTDIGALGNRQDQLTSTQTELGQTSTTLQSQLSNLQDADLSQVAAKLSQAQTQLQASYQILASLGQLSLAKFLPAA